MPRAEVHAHMPESSTNIIAIIAGIILILIAVYLPYINGGFRFLFGVVGAILIVFGIGKFISG